MSGMAWFGLEGRVALVTGASSGLGRHFAHTLAAAGCVVGLAARRAGHLATLADEIAAEGGRAIPLTMDVTDAASVEASLATLTERGGSVINIASITGERPVGGAAAYSISKAAIISMTKVMAQDLARHGIRVNALAPGYFSTDMNRDVLASEVGQTMLRRSPMRRAGQMEELEGPLLLLASDRGSFMTGAIVPVDGGHLVSPL